MTCCVPCEQESYSPGHEPVVSWRLLEDGLLLC